MKKFLVSISVGILLLVPTIATLAAPDILGEDGAGGNLLGGIAENAGYSPNDTSSTALSAKVGQIVTIALSLVGTIFFALTVYAGFLWMTASGNDEKVKKATDILKAALIGLILSLAAFSISVFVTSRIVGYTVAPAPAVGAPASAGTPTTGFWNGFAQAASGYWDILTR